MADTLTTNYGLTKPENGKPTGWDVELNGDLDIIDSALKTNADAVALKADTSSLATVATSGSYADLSSKPSIPAAQVNSDWNASSGVAQISNKPSIPPVIPVSPLQIGASDTGISRLGAASLAIGNGTAGNTTGKLTLNSVILTNAPTWALSVSAGGANAQIAKLSSSSTNGVYLDMTASATGGKDWLLGVTGGANYVVAVPAGKFIFYQNTDGAAALMLGTLGPQIAATNAYQFSNTWNDAADSGISRLGAASLAIGNGTGGDKTGTLTLANLILSATQSPASNAAGTPGQLAYDANYVYVCISSGVWKRSPLTGGY